MNKLKLFPEEFPISGGVNASELTKSTQSPVLNDIELLLREAVQNSHDQRNSIELPVHFHVQIKKLRQEQMSFIQNALFENTNDRHLPISAKNLSELYVIYISDQNTRGLNGPANAREASTEGNFVNFFLKIGRNAESDSEAGGAFGHGRAVFFNSSKFSTAFAYTRYLDQEILKSRFFGMTLADNFSANGLNYTGKWFWGDSNNSQAGPFEGQTADEVADFLGMLSPIGSSTGTVLTILAPKFIDSDSDARNYVRALKYYAEKNLWPLLMIDVSNKSNFTLSIQFEEEELITIDVASESSVSAKYVDLYKRLAESGSVINGGTVQLSKKINHISDTNRQLRRGEPLGYLNWVRTMAFDNFSENLNNDIELGLAGIPKEFPPLTGIALFRKPKLVVQYLTFQSQENDLKIIGYFESSSNANYFFRLSEKDTHDSWDISRMQKALGPTQANPVRKVYETIKDVYASFDLPLEPSSEANWAPSAMLELGQLMSYSGTGQGRGKGRGSSGRGEGGGGEKLPINVRPNMNVALNDFSESRVLGSFEFQVLRNERIALGDDFEINFETKIVLIDGYETIDATIPESQDPRIEEIIVNGIGITSRSKVVIDPSMEKTAVIVKVSTPKNLRVACSHTIKRLPKKANG